MQLTIGDTCEHKYVLSTEPKPQYDGDETLYVHRFFCEKCLKIRTKTRHVNRFAGEYWTEGKDDR